MSNENSSLLTYENMRDKQLQSSENDKFDKIRNWLNELHIAHGIERHTPSWSSLNTSSSVIECSTFDCPPKLHTGNTSNWIIPETSSDESLESQKKCAGPISNDHIQNSVGNSVANELSSNNGECMKPLRSSLSSSNSVIECSLSSNCPQKLDMKSTSYWIIPETSSDGSLKSLKQKGCAGLIANDHIQISEGNGVAVELSSSNGENMKPLRSSLSSSNSVIECSQSSNCPQKLDMKSSSYWIIPETSSDGSVDSLKQKSLLDHVSYDHITKLARKDTSVEILPDSSNDESVKPARRKKACFFFNDSECNDDSSDHFQLSTVVKTTGEVLPDEHEKDLCKISLPSSKNYDNDKCSRLSIHSDDSIISVSSADRILTAVYGKNWDKESVLTPLVQKKNMVMKKPPQTEDITSIEAILSEFYGSNWDKEKVLTPFVKRQKGIKEKENTSPVIEKKVNVERPFKISKTKLIMINKNPTISGISKNTAPQKMLSFLQSLSVCSPKRCNPKALLYKKEFKKNKEELCSYLFRLYNREVFETKLPFNLKIDWNVRLTHTAGRSCHRFVYGSNGKIRSAHIELSTKVCSTAERVRDTLIHELCHAAAWLLNGFEGCHGRVWKAWTKKAMTRFPELPPITRCHRYKIDTKYTYKCKNCSHSYGRHSKSLGPRRRCGRCYGELKLLVNIKKKNADGGVQSTTRSPRTASGFALYVKENYKTTKENDSGLTHAEIMKFLGNRFAALKVGSVQ